MKHLMIIVLLAFTLPAFSQEVISENRTIEIQEDSLYFLKTTIVYDNETNYPDTSISRMLLGDSTDALNFLFVDAVDGQQAISARMAKAFLANEQKSRFNDSDDLYESIAGEKLYERLEEEYYNLFEGRYRIKDISGDSTWTATLIRVGAKQRYRLEHDATGERLVMLIRSRNNFQVNDLNGENIDFWYDRVNRPNGNRVFKPTSFVGRTHNIIITKIN